MRNGEAHNAIAMPPRDVKPMPRAVVALVRCREQAHVERRRLREWAPTDRAKAILIRQRRLSKPDAYGWSTTNATRRGRHIARGLVHETEGDTA